MVQIPWIGILLAFGISVTVTLLVLAVLVWRDRSQP
jgi:hypothetical protein